MLLRSRLPTRRRTTGWRNSGALAKRVSPVGRIHQPRGKNNDSRRVGLGFLTLTLNPILNRRAESKSKITSKSETVPMHAKNRKRAFHEPGGKKNASRRLG